MAATDVVVIRELSKIYRQGDINVTALNRISLSIREGEFLSLMGPTGSGKSTLTQIIAGVDRPTSGECCVQGIDLTHLDESRSRIGGTRTSASVFQTFNLIPVLTAFENGSFHSC